MSEEGIKKYHSTRRLSRIQKWKVRKIWEQQFYMLLFIAYLLCQYLRLMIDVQKCIKPTYQPRK